MRLGSGRVGRQAESCRRCLIGAVVSFAGDALVLGRWLVS